MGKVGMVFSNSWIVLILKFGPNETLSQKIKGLRAFKLQSSHDLTYDMKLRNLNLQTAGNVSLNSLTPTSSILFLQLSGYKYEYFLVYMNW